LRIRNVGNVAHEEGREKRPKVVPLPHPVS
jgi:hypothetical protein